MLSECLAGLDDERSGALFTWGADFRSAHQDGAQPDGAGKGGSSGGAEPPDLRGGRHIGALGCGDAFGRLVPTR